MTRVPVDKPGVPNKKSNKSRSSTCHHMTTDARNNTILGTTDWDNSETVYSVPD